ncbi:MAG TPA: hypothetical protein VKW08_08945 [Xanthobacteraceae bacterium]|nr:hypothetical protein [Xanthobacteraceae bacterium]
MGRCSYVTVAALAAWLGLGPARAQEPTTKVWDIKLGTPIAGLPLEEFVDPACGTNGGPPSRVLASFADFAVCPIDKSTGLHEVWFRYDDELEYIARAHRSESMIRLYEVNVLGDQPIITSLLIDDAGLVQGYRIVNDPRAPADLRIDAYGLADIFKGIAPPGLDCVDLPPAEGERPIEDLFIKQKCELKAGGQVTRIEARHYYKPGQFLVDPNDNHVTENEFESSARLEVFRPPAK